MKKIVIPEDIAESGKKYLRDRGYELKTGVSTDEQTLKSELADADGLIVRNARYEKSVFQDAKKLKVIARHGTGTDNIDVKAAEELGIWVVNGPVANINAVAEYTIAQIISLSCGLVKSDGCTRRKDWTYRLNFKRYELAGTALGIVGYGRIGKLVAEKALGLGMKVLAYDTRSDAPEQAGVTVTGDLDEVLRASDYVTLHIPSTDATRWMFDASMFKKMKAGSFFINNARGDLYVQDDLIDAIESGHLSGAALDVYKDEPLLTSRLFSMDQVILSQHNAGLSEESKDRMSLYAAMGADQVLSGEIPQWPVNHPAVY